MDPKTVYAELQSLLRQQLSQVTYEGWFQNMEAIDIEKQGDRSILVLSTSNDLALTIVPAKFTHIIENCFDMLNYSHFSFRLVSSSAAQPSPAVSSPSQAYIDEAHLRSGLNPRYTFDSFVVGPHNKFAYHSCLGVAETPGFSYNPLFIWGDSGLGKTHLLHAIGNYVLETQPDKKVLYVPSETFMNELINSIGATKDENEAFREKYRKIDVLLIDDVQFLSKKESTQNEFFHTFNSLYNSNKQIVISADKPPESIEHLADRIVSRFKWGLISDIQSPDYETRIAILKKKTDQNHLNIGMDVLSFIADHIDSNIRDLEGALTRVEAYRKLLSPDTQITIETAAAALRDYIGKDIKKVISVQRIIETVCEYYNISVEDIKSKKKPQNIVYPRQVAMYLCRKLTVEPLKIIGKSLGGRDHTTIKYGADRIAMDLTNVENSELIRALEDIERSLNGG